MSTAGDSSTRQTCAAGQTELDVSVMLFLTLYVASAAIVIVIGLLKVFVGVYRRKSQARKARYEQKLREMAARTQIPQARTSVGGPDQGLAVKRILFLKMNRNVDSLDGGYVADTPKRVSRAEHQQKPWETDVKKIKFKRKIGAGNFGEVWVGTWMGSNVAIKTVLKRMANNREFVAKFMEEIQLMSELNHPNIVMFLGACIQPPSICLILEYCVHGNLIDFLQSAKGSDINISMHLILKMALDIARGIKYLHEKVNIIQRDIKGRNVLVDENLNAKISDFGLSRIKNEDDAGLTACGTPAWTAPEVVRMEDYTEKVDVYSFGVVLWELFMREEPYAGEGGIQIAYAAAEQGLRPKVPRHAPERYANLMKECWADSPHDRPNFSEILERLFQMMKDESNPFKAAEFYFGSRRQELDAELKGLLDDSELNAGMFAEDYNTILEDRKRLERLHSSKKLLAASKTGANDIVRKLSRTKIKVPMFHMMDHGQAKPVGGLAALLPPQDPDSFSSVANIAPVTPDGDMTEEEVPDFFSAEEAKVD
mmetsp:Transcript_13187/g.37210  ORF Transcript_13187/g.37210 Transcript_13187/m.37210 type:complete len:539 (+) Transcript_13187:60-1676(+)